MKSFSVLAILATALSTISQTFAAPDPNFHIYLAFGQSNMEGQGPIEGQDRTVDKRFQMISTVSGCNGRQVGNWYDAIPPLANCDGKLGPVDYFGRTLVKKLPQQIKVGVAVVAIAGCDIQLFEKNNYKSYNLQSYMQGRVNAYGGNPYGRLIEMGKKAQQVGVIKGILLHQGETNTGQQNWPNRVKAIYQDMLKDLGLKAEEVPLLAGEVVTSAQGGQCGSMNNIIAQLPKTIPTAHVISAQGLGQQGDGLHFSSAAYRTFGERYATEMLKILGDVKVVDTNPTTTVKKTTTTTKASNPTQGSCWSSSLGFPCCSGKVVVEYTDASGRWGIQNNNWCGIVNSNTSTCWAKALGYNCCSTNTCRNAVYNDTDGQWDIENNQWCGISTANTLC
ncbi:acetylxylan esterase [Piromyces finnis]|uniref:Acetylxylan esterase n=1 Tax=Piromyces finnis TaxID=1754191 RepID=A0A1Y1VAZ7_9FUNG|nr:acetylxylan esterase [Piromyces finnis]|eukprot:ORX51465.1 acetylxylan esterase [Piromyces finnis]